MVNNMSMSMCKRSCFFTPILFSSKLIKLVLLCHFYLCWNTIILNLNFVSGDNLALLSGTLRTYQKAACDDEWMSLRCPAGTTISIQLAQYGKVSPSPALCSSPSSTHPELLDISNPHNNVTCLWPQAIQTVVGLCQKKTSCKFQTSPRTFGGDPCPGTRKYVEVAFKCRPSEFKSVIGCEDEVIQLKCNRSARLAIYSASFGRTEYESIQCPQPKRIPEETCLSSYATETVMQICHGKRKCALGVEPATFGNPCKPESRMYLKVIHTCIPRKVLKEKYQGEPEPDEMFDDDNDQEPPGDTPLVGGVIEQPSIFSTDHSNKAGGMASIKTHQTSLSPPPDNPEKFYLYVAISVAAGLLMLVILLLLKIGITRHRANSSNGEGGENRRVTTNSTKQPSSSSVGPLTSGLSDIDELSIVMDPSDLHSGGDLHHSILRLSSPTSDIDQQKLFPLALRTSSSFNSSGTGGGTSSSTLGRGNENVVRFSNCPKVKELGRYPEETELINPRTLTLNRNSENIHFYYE